jgi:hypothetical protein
MQIRNLISGLADAWFGHSETMCILVFLDGCHAVILESVGCANVFLKPSGTSTGLWLFDARYARPTCH